MASERVKCMVCPWVGQAVVDADGEHHTPESWAELIAHWQDSAKCAQLVAAEIDAAVRDGD